MKDPDEYYNDIFIGRECGEVVIVSDVYKDSEHIVVFLRQDLQNYILDTGSFHRIYEYIGCV